MTGDDSVQVMIPVCWLFFFFLSKLGVCTLELKETRHEGNRDKRIRELSVTPPPLSSVRAGSTEQLSHPLISALQALNNSAEYNIAVPDSLQMVRHCDSDE